jgi:hypothetical protein
MKKLFIVAAVAVFGLTACKKEWTCVCDLAGTKVEVKSGTKLSKKDAETWCETASTGVCELK